MPLHLLSKKSWNVYAPTSIARVRADEAAAALAEAEDDQRQQEHDAEVRLALLRGLPAPPPLSPPQAPGRPKRGRDDDETRSAKDEYRKRRRLAGEDDTDRDIRLAREERERPAQSGQGQGSSKQVTGPVAPIMDHAGHIQLFAPPPPKGVRAEKNAEAEAERKRKEREMEDQYTMRFSNAAGLRKGIKEVPWYAGGGYTGTEEAEGVPQKGQEAMVAGGGRDAFGREDANRPKRDAARMASSDPMAAMKQAQMQIKAVEKDREKWRHERERELRELKEAQRSEEKREERRRRMRDAERGKRPENVDDDELEGFTLDAPPPEAKRSRSNPRESRHPRPLSRSGGQEKPHERSSEYRRRRLSHSRTRSRKDDDGRRVRGNGDYHISRIEHPER